MRRPDLLRVLRVGVLFLGAASASSILSTHRLSGWLRAAAAIVLAEIVFYGYQCWRCVSEARRALACKACKGTLPKSRPCVLRSRCFSLYVAGKGPVAICNGKELAHMRGYCVAFLLIATALEFVAPKEHK